MKMMEPQSIKKFELQQTPPMAEVIWLQNLENENYAQVWSKYVCFLLQNMGIPLK